MKLVTGVDFKFSSATLNGYQRFKIKDKTYPGIIKSPFQTINGVLYSGLDDHALILLDEFEDILYDRCLVDIENETDRAFVYVIKDEYRICLANEAWSLEEFKSRYLNKYLRDINSW